MITLRLLVTGEKLNINAVIFSTCYIVMIPRFLSSCNVQHSEKGAW